MLSLSGGSSADPGPAVSKTAGFSPGSGSEGGFASLEAEGVLTSTRPDEPLVDTDPEEPPSEQAVRRIKKHSTANIGRKEKTLVRLIKGLLRHKYIICETEPDAALLKHTNTYYSINHATQIFIISSVSTPQNLVAFKNLDLLLSWNLQIQRLIDLHNNE